MTEQKPIRPRQKRRALSAPQGRTLSTGHPYWSRTIEKSLKLSTRSSSRQDSPDQDLTHGFHSYPARLAPDTARHLLLSCTQQGPVRTFLDPFCGSGTTLVEALRLNLQTWGVDVNPLAVAISRMKTARWTEERAQTWMEVVQEIADKVTSREVERLKMKWDEARFYEPHIYAELMTLRTAIEHRGANDTFRNALLLVFSSIVVKVSKQRADTRRGDLVQKKLAKGSVTRLFVRKAEELAHRLIALAKVVSPTTAAPVVQLGDARKLIHIKDETIDVVLTSPPYPGTYDYYDHHVRRYPWLDFSKDDLTFGARNEIGARRTSHKENALKLWQEQTFKSLLELRRVCKPGALLFFEVGDSYVGETFVDGAAQFKLLAARTGLTEIAAASQSRPDYVKFSKQPRFEHMLLFKKER